MTKKKINKRPKRKNPNIQIGESIDWDKIPDNTLVWASSDYGIRRGEFGHKIGSKVLIKWWMIGSYVRSGKGEIVALNVPLDATTQDMKELIKQYEKDFK
jgi:hypothetical protein